MLLLALTLSQFTTYGLAIAAGLAATAAAIKALPIIWNTFLDIIRFFGSFNGLTKIEELETGQTGLEKSIEDIAITLKDIEAQSNKEYIADALAEKYERVLSIASYDAIALTINAFKAHAAHCVQASFILKINPKGSVKFIWGNENWYSLHGIGYTEALSGQFWDCVDAHDRQQVLNAALSAAEQRIEFKVTYKLNNLLREDSHIVTVSSWPLAPYGGTGEDVIYIGGLDVKR